MNIPSKSPRNLIDYDIHTSDSKILLRKFYSLIQTYQYNDLICFAFKPTCFKATTPK